MSILNQARIIIYRFHEKGLEIFLINSDLENDPNVWNLPEGALAQELKHNEDEIIMLEDTLDETGNAIPTIAIEGDWHNIPSIRGLIKHDVKLAKKMVNHVLPSMKNGTFFGIKEAFKKVMPQEYAAIKEIKDIILTRNTLKNM